MYTCILYFTIVVTYKSRSRDRILIRFISFAYEPVVKSPKSHTNIDHRGIYLPNQLHERYIITEITES